MYSCRRRMSVTSALGLVALAVLQFSARAEDADALSRGAIRPSLVQLTPGETCAFRVVLAPKWLQAARVADEVAWSVNGIVGGNETLGTIGADGMYHAPKAKPRPREIHIGAVTKQASNSRLWATVIVGKGTPSYEVVSKWDEPADGTVHLKDPSGIAIERDGNLIISDAAKSQVYRFSPKGELLGSIGEGGGNAPGHFDNPRSVAIDPDGNIVVSDLRTGPPRIQVFNHEGKLINAFAQKGIGPGLLMQPCGMAFDPSGRLLVADADTMRVNVYGRDGKFVEAWQRTGVRPGEFSEPYGVVIDPNGDVCVPNYYGPCQKFTNAGAFLYAFAFPDPPKGPVAYTASAGDQWGDVFLAVRDTAGLVENSVEPEPKPSRILKYNTNGEFVAAIPLWNDERGENACAVDGCDRLYVLFKRGGRTGVALLEPR